MVLTKETDGTGTKVILELRKISSLEVMSRVQISQIPADYSLMGDIESGWLFVVSQKVS